MRDDELRSLFAVVGQKLDHIINHQHQQLELQMIDRAELARLAADVTANTDATLATTQAITGLLASNEELTRKLQDAITTDDTPAIKAAADAIEANNTAMRAAVPAVAAAVVAGTAADPNAPVT